jgi:hypothetical protein
MVLTKEELIGVLQNEVRILVHLAGKVKPEMLDYRPSPKQRSILELLRYLTVMGPVLTASVKAGSFLVDQWNALEGKSKGLDFDSTVKELEALGPHYAQAIGEFTDEEMRGDVNLFGAPGKRGPELVNLVVCGHAAYRTQLFLYLKSCGRDELNTMNLWAGVDGQA